MDGQSHKHTFNEPLKIELDDIMTHFDNALVFVREDPKPVENDLYATDLPYQRPDPDSSVNSNSDTITDPNTVTDATANALDGFNQNDTRPLITGPDENCNTYDQNSATSSSSDSQTEGSRGGAYELDENGKMSAYVNFESIYKILNEKGLDQSHFVLDEGNSPRA